MRVSGFSQSQCPPLSGFMSAFTRPRLVSSPCTPSFPSTPPISVGSFPQRSEMGIVLGSWGSAPTPGLTGDCSVKKYGEQATPEQRAERQRTVLSRFSDWTRPRWAGLHNHLDVKRLVDQGLLETRTVVLTVGGKPATEYRLTPAGTEAIKEGYSVDAVA